jgi:UDP-N-acetylglucosamine--N-acetylmuramyl-(pentapeptide) pyrophosphoryl-undecaprenol N-acetylglucosamine transferase
MTLVIAGGGTGGHLYPGIAVAQELLRRMPDARVSFVGTARGLEARVIPKEGFELDLIRSAGIKGKSWTARARGAALVPVGFAEAWRVITRRRPDVVMGVGGFSSGPVVMARRSGACRPWCSSKTPMPGSDEPLARALGPRRGGHLRADVVVLRQPRVRQRQSSQRGLFSNFEFRSSKFE